MGNRTLSVGHYYQLKTGTDQIIAFAVLYGFERGKNKDVYTVKLYTKKGDVEFPLKEAQFHQWMKEGRIREITADEALTYVTEP